MRAYQASSTQQRSGAVVPGAVSILAHVPGLVRYGSKPSRVLGHDSSVNYAQFAASLRSYREVVQYAPHQAYIGGCHPRDLPPRPWTGSPIEGAASSVAAGGEILPEAEFLGLLTVVDDFGIVALEQKFATKVDELMQQHPTLSLSLPSEKIEKAVSDIDAVLEEPGSLPLWCGIDPTPIGAVRRAHEEDEALRAEVLLENLAAKATATLALLRLLQQTEVPPESVDYVLSCGEEAIGDRYQRGGGNLAKAVAEACGLSQASGADIKDFCAAPAVALVIAASLVTAGVFHRIAIVGGGSLPKLGMKFQGHLKAGLPILEDVLGGTAILVECDDGLSPRVRLDSVGRHTIACGSSNTQIMEQLALAPLSRINLRATDIDDFATELHNPEITEPQGSGNIADRNYRTIARLGRETGRHRPRSDCGIRTDEGYARIRTYPGTSSIRPVLCTARDTAPHGR